MLNRPAAAAWLERPERQNDVLPWQHILVFTPKQVEEVLTV